MAGQNTLTFTDAGFDQEVLRSDVPVLVDSGLNGAALAGRWRPPSMS
jgi:hypothetical protein